MNSSGLVVAATKGYLNSSNTKKLYTKLPWPVPLVSEEDYQRAKIDNAFRATLKKNIKNAVFAGRGNFLRRFGMDFTPYGLGEGKKFLDAGCGTGHKTAYLAMLFPKANITAIDISDESLKYLRFLAEVCDMQNIKTECRDLSKMQEFDGEFDHVFSMGVLMLLPEPKVGFLNVTKCLKPSGLLSLYLYDLWGRTTEILFNRFTVELANNDECFKRRIIDNFGTNKKKKGWFDEPILNVMGETRKKSHKDFIQDILPPFLYRLAKKSKKILNTQKMREAEQFRLHNTWDGCANPIVHNYEVNSVYQMLDEVGFVVKTMRFASHLNLELEARSYLKKTLQERGLSDLTRDIDRMDDRRVYFLTECLIKPRGLYVLAAHRKT